MVYVCEKSKLNKSYHEQHLDQQENNESKIIFGSLIDDEREWLIINSIEKQELSFFWGGGYSHTSMFIVTLLFIAFILIFIKYP